MRIDVYDFDGTIYEGDSTVDLVRFCLQRHPSLLCGLPAVGAAALSMAVGKSGLTQMKSTLFGEMARRIDLAREAELFWQGDRPRQKLGAWFWSTPRDLPIVIASASPEFELCYAAKLLGHVDVIGTRCDARTGRLLSPNCKGEEKVRRLKERLGEFTVRAMYTDNEKADAPLLAMANERYLLRHGQVSRLT